MKEIAVGIMANMLCHEKVFLGILEKTRYLEKLLRLLEVKDSPTLDFRLAEARELWTRGR